MIEDLCLREGSEIKVGNGCVEEVVVDVRLKVVERGCDVTEPSRGGFSPSLFSLPDWLAGLGGGREPSKGKANEVIVTLA